MGWRNNDYKEWSDRKRAQAERPSEEQEARQRQQFSVYFEQQRRLSSPGGGAGGCFPKGTLVATPSGPTRIEQLQAGDNVYSIGNGTKFQVQRILRTVKHPRCWIFRITLADGRTLRTTRIHSLRLNHRWQRADRARPGDRITICEPDSPMKDIAVVAASPESVREPVYNLIVADAFTFIADGVLVHSFTYFRGLREWLWRFRARELRLVLESSANVDHC